MQSTLSAAKVQHSGHPGGNQPSQNNWATAPESRGQTIRPQLLPQLLLALAPRRCSTHARIGNIIGGIEMIDDHNIDIVY